jgi:hypothetical protein
MRILLVTSALVLVAMLWATLSIIRHVRVAQRKSRVAQRKGRGVPTFEDDMPEAISVATGETTRIALLPHLPPLPARFAAPAYASSENALSAHAEPAVRQQAPVLLPAAVLHAFTDSASQRAAAKASSVAPPVVRPLQAAPAAVKETQSLRIFEFVPGPELSTMAPAAPASSTAQAQASRRIPSPPPTPVIDPQQRRPVRSASPSDNNNAQELPSHRQDWIYFNKDMGDLSDPTPSRIRDRVRAR